MMRLSRRAVLTGGVAAFGSAVMADAPLTALRPLARPGDVVLGDGGPPRPQDRIVARPDLASVIARSGVTGDTGVVVYDLDTFAVLEQHLPETALMPASVTKVATALYALDSFPEGHRFTTQLVATGPIEDGVLDGDLVLVGGSDPVFDTDDLAGLLDAVMVAGVTDVTGGLMVYAGGLPEVSGIDPQQLPQLGYNPGVSGMNLNFNRVHFAWERAGEDYAITMDARTANYRPAVRVATMDVADRRSPIFAYDAAGGRDAWSVARHALGQTGSRWLPVRQPAVYAGDVLRTLAADKDLILTAPRLVDERPEGQVLATHDSPPLIEIVRGMLRFSTNLTAEVLGRAASQERGVGAATLEASASAMSGWLAAKTGQHSSFVDHSGLSDRSRVSAASMMRILADADAGPLRGVLKSIALTTSSGNLLADPPGEVLAKTGTLNFVSALAGYLDTTSGRRLAFAIFSGDSAARTVGLASGAEQPTGASAFNNRAKRLQQTLLQRWGRVFDVVEPEVVDASRR